MQGNRSRLKSSRNPGPRTYQTHQAKGRLGILHLDRIKRWTSSMGMAMAIYPLPKGPIGRELQPIPGAPALLVPILDAACSTCHLLLCLFTYLDLLSICPPICINPALPVHLCGCAQLLCPVPTCSLVAAHSSSISSSSGSKASPGSVSCLIISL